MSKLRKQKRRRGLVRKLREQKDKTVPVSKLREKNISEEKIEDAKKKKRYPARKLTEQQKEVSGN